MDRILRSVGAIARSQMELPSAIPPPKLPASVMQMLKRISATILAPGALILITVPANGAVVVNNAPFEQASQFALNSQATNNDIGAIYQSGNLNIYTSLATGLWALPVNQATYLSMADMISDWNFGIQDSPTGEVYNGWSGTKNSDGSVSLTKAPVGSESWLSTDQNPSQDMQAYTVLIPKSQLEFDGVAGYDPNTDASIVLSDSTRPDAFVGYSENELDMWQGEGTFYQVAVPEPKTYTFLAGAVALGLAAARRRKAKVLGPKPGSS